MTVSSGRTLVAVLPEDTVYWESPLVTSGHTWCDLVTCVHTWSRHSSYQFDTIGYDCGSCDHPGAGGLPGDVAVSVSAMSEVGTHGFAVLLYNAISSVKFEPGSGPGDWGALTPAYEDIQVKLL